MAPDKRSSLSGVDLFLLLSEVDILELESRVPEVGLGQGQIFYTPWHKGESLFLAPRRPDEDIPVQEKQGAHPFD